jgi:uncharacterized membrane protein YtjA (UPF0391 family)
MLRWALIFFLVAIAAGFFGFGGVAVATAEIAKLLFYLFVAALIITLIMNFTGSGRGRMPPL